MKMTLRTRTLLAVDALNRRYLLRPDLSNIDLWVASPGGVGTTFLMEYLAGFVRINDPYDSDGLKHWPRPPNARSLAEAPRMIFISGKPEQIVASIARREWLRIQSVKVGSVGGAVLDGVLQQRAFRGSIETQIEAWKNCKSEKLLFLEFDDLWDSVGAIAQHAGIGQSSFEDNFPARKQRHTDRKPKDE